MMQIMNWLHQHQMNPCHMWIHPQTLDAEAQESKVIHHNDWIKQVRSMGYMGYEVANLAELPNLLGGAKRYA
ncbi:hypothetical protein D3C73_1408360 [compost metagenome]